MGEKEGALDSLLSAFLFWGLAAMIFFFSFVVLLITVTRMEGPVDMALLFIDLLCGFAWIGTTSFSRHVFILLKGYIGKRVTTFEFLSTQFVVILFPFIYRNVRKEAEIFRKRKSNRRTS
jgi:hypothetical protein